MYHNEGRKLRYLTEICLVAEVFCVLVGDGLSWDKAPGMPDDVDLKPVSPIVSY